jgi:NADH-quinone oxidoreductase subunit M
MDITWCTFIPLITAGLLLLFPASWKGLIKSTALLGALITFILAIGLVRGYSAREGDGDARAKLETVQEEILFGRHGGRPAPSLGLERLGPDPALARERWKASFLPQAGEVFTPEQREQVRLQVRELAGGAAGVAESAWEEAVELSYAMGAEQTQHIHFVEFAPWIRSFKVNYFMGVDGLSLPLVWLTALLSLLCIAYSWTIEKGTKGFYILFLVLETGLIGVFCALDFFLFYVFWEVVLLPMYFLIGIWGGENRIYAAIKFFIYTLVGSVLMFIVMLVMFFTAEPHTFNILALMKVVPGFSMGLQWWLFLALFIGFAIKVPVFPFHTWLPDAHVEAPTAVSVILAGVLLKMGGYGLFRFSYPMTPDAATSHFFIALIAVLGMINIVYGAFCALAQKDFKKLVAYSSVSHMGYVLLGLAALTYSGVNGAALQMFNHGVSSAMMFLLVGVIYDRAHHRDLTRFGGIALQMPWYTGLATVGFFASLGLPGLNGFVSEFLCFLGAWDSDASLITTAGVGIASRWIVVVSFLGIILAAVYILWTIQRVYLGTIRNEEFRRFPDVSFREVFALAPLAFLCIVLGVFPGILIDFMNSSLATMTDMVRAVLPN